MIFLLNSLTILKYVHIVISNDAVYVFSPNYSMQIPSQILPYHYVSNCFLSPGLLVIVNISLVLEKVLQIISFF